MHYFDMGNVWAAENSLLHRSSLLTKREVIPDLFIVTEGDSEEKAMGSALLWIDRFQ